MAQQLEDRDANLSRLANYAFARSNMFSLIAVSFFDPTSELAQRLIDGSLISEFESSYQDLVTYQAAGNKNALQPEVLESLKETQERYINQNPDDLLTELKIEYARLFIGPGIPVVPPYETFYQGKKKEESLPLLMVSPAAIAVENAYRQAGIKISADLNEPPDHFATEVEFLYFLCRKEAESWARGKEEDAKKWAEMQASFIDNHLGQWGEQFCQEVEDKSSHPFYKAMASTAIIFLRVRGG
jgi:TorA maturation chaperone TorD